MLRIKDVILNIKKIKIKKKKIVRKKSQNEEK